MAVGESEEWWSPQQAAAATALHEQTIRNWAKQKPPRVKSRPNQVGQRQLVEVLKSDVLREADLSNRRKGLRPRAASLRPPSAQTEGELLDRATVLEELVRRRQIIDEHREEIERLHLEISREQREIERLLLGPTRVPTN